VGHRLQRIIFEWGVIFSVGMAVVVSTLWVVSLCSASTLFHLRIATLLGGDSLLVLVEHGNLWLCNSIGVDPSGEIRAEIVGPPIASDFRRGDRLRRFTLPGIDFQYYWLAPWRNSIWSLKSSLLIPAVSVIALAVMLYKLLKRVRQAAADGPRVDPAASRVHVLDRPS